jgi:uncharacterized damage-inducible protein DinB
MPLSPSSGFPYYIDLAGDSDVKALFESSHNMDILSSISEEKSKHRYAPGKWSIKQLLGHMADHERIMMYRALRFSRKDPTQLAGYEQNDYVDHARFDEISYRDLLQDFRNIRNSSISFIRMLSSDQLQLKGMAWKFEISVADLLKAAIGHEIHHMGVLREKYLAS